MKSTIWGTKVHIVIATAVISTAIVGGSMLLPEDGDVFVPITPTLRTELPTFSGVNPSGYRSVGQGTAVSMRPSSSLMRGVSPVSVQSSGSSYGGRNFGQTGTGYTVRTASANFGDHSVGMGGGGSSAASGGYSSSSVSNVGGSAAPMSFSLPVSAPGRSLLASVMPSGGGSVVPGGPLGVYNGEEGDHLGVYTGDETGVITGDENAHNDNPIIDNYGQPIGDTLWPLMLMALAYLGWRYRRKVKSIITK